MTASRTSRPRFRYNAYWGTWSLVLTDRCAAKPGYGPSVEIDLQPINGWDFKPNVPAVLAVNVRRHCTTVGARDRLAHELPADVAKDSRWHMGAEVFDWLTDPRTEILGIIDWAKYQAWDNGGCPLAMCVKDAFAHLVPASVAPRMAVVLAA